MKLFRILGLTMVLASALLAPRTVVAWTGCSNCQTDVDCHNCTGDPATFCLSHRCAE
jgi:hypothetical protein